jgi:hypothetical protein
MRTLHLGMLAACAVLLAVPVVISSSIAQTPQPAPAAPPPPAPQMPPSIPAAYVTDLMTAQGSQAFGAQWKTMEAKIVEARPIPGAMPQYKTVYDIAPKAGDSTSTI